MNKEFYQDYCRKVSQNYSELAHLAPEIEKSSHEILEALKRGNKILVCGNGGSAADSQHFVAELVGRYKTERQALAAVALSVDTSILTAVSNDYGYEQVFARQVTALGQTGDLLCGISTSGNSQNVVLAMQQAKIQGLRTLALTGQNGGKLQDIANFVIKVPSTHTNHIQEMHIGIIHMWCEYIDTCFFNEK